LVLNLKPKAVLILILVLALCGLAQAATVGKISGKVTDKETGSALPGVAVTINGTTMGALTDVEGKFFILNVPVGSYSLKAELIGYASVELQKLNVSVDLTTNADFQLSSKTLTGELQVVIAERPLIILDQTKSLKIVSGEEIQQLPTRGYTDVVGSSAVGTRGGREQSNQPALNIRGGRQGDVAYFVDGFSQQDPLTNMSTTAINNNAIEEISISTGGFNAEYGWISSGAINVTTKEGAKDFSGAFEGSTDEFMGSDNRFNYNVLAFNLDGPLLPNSDKTSFFASMERRRLGDRTPRSTADGRLPHNDLSGWSWQGKLRYDLNQKNILRLGTLGSYENWREFRMNYYFNGTHAPRYLDENYSYYAKWTNNISPKTFFELGGTYYLTKRLRGDETHWDDIYAYGRPDGNPTFDNTNLFWIGDDLTTPEDEGHVWEDILRRSSSYLGLNFDLTSQVNEYNEMQFGAELERHSLRYYNHLDPTKIDTTVHDPVLFDQGAWADANFFGYDKTGENNVDDGPDGAKKPYMFAVYLQDKFEFEGLVVNAGLRYDYLNANTDRLRNEERPLDPNNVLADPDSHSDEEIENAVRLDDGDFESAKAEQKLSPRLGVGFPVSDKTVFHVNYGKFFQRPELQYLYVGTRWLERMVKDAPYYAAIGNPNLEPEETTAYEVGLAHQLGDFTSLNITAYYKDVNGLTEVINQPSSPNAFATYRNQDFGTIKGLDFSLKMRRTRSVSTELNYSLSYAAGTGSYATSQGNIAWTNTERPIRISPLDYDQRHKITAIIDVRATGGQGPKLGSIHPFENAGINFVFRAGSGTPYTPMSVYNEISLASVTPTPIGKVNSRTGPWTYRLDFKANKTFQIARLDWDVYLWVINLFDTENALDVYEGTGRADNTGWLSTPDGESFASRYGEDGVAKYNFKQRNPSSYDTPRQVRLGLRLMF
jgi:outer membrane receptor protein involved in Fe transport